MSLGNAITPSNDPVILHVEDDKFFTSLISGELIDMNVKTKIVHASTLEEMEQCIAVYTNILIVILDGNFPKEQDGIASFQGPAAIQLAQNANVSTIFAFSTEEDKFNSLPKGSGPDAFFHKPGSVQSLVDSIIKKLALLEEEIEVA